LSGAWPKSRPGSGHFAETRRVSRSSAVRPDRPWPAVPRGREEEQPLRRSGRLGFVAAVSCLRFLTGCRSLARTALLVERGPRPASPARVSRASDPEPLSSGRPTRKSRALAPAPAAPEPRPRRTYARAARSYARATAHLGAHPSSFSCHAITEVVYLTPMVRGKH
jgi:hypothetical protein